MDHHVNSNRPLLPRKNIPLISGGNHQKAQILMDLATEKFNNNDFFQMK